MKLIKESLVAIFPVVLVFWLGNGWSENTSKFSRFTLLLMTSFVAYTTFKGLGKASLADINGLIEISYTSINSFLLTLSVLALSVMARYLSIVSASIASSLIPKP
jgi:hypothetical protein